MIPALEKEHWGQGGSKRTLALRLDAAKSSMTSWANVRNFSFVVMTKISHWRVLRVKEYNSF